MNGLLLVELLFIAGALIWLFAEGLRLLVETRSRRRRAPRFEAPRRIAAAIEDPTEDEHDWDGFLRDLTGPVEAEEYEPRLAEQAIELPREGQGETP